MSRQKPIVRRSRLENVIRFVISVSASVDDALVDSVRNWPRFKFVLLDFEFVRNGERLETSMKLAYVFSI